MASGSVSFDSNIEAGNTIQVADSSTALQEESMDLRSQSKDNPVVELAAEPGQGLWSVARQAYRLVGVADPEPQEVKALAEDISQRNGISMDATLGDNQKLLVKLPGKLASTNDSDNSTEAARTEPAEARKAGLERREGPDCSSSWEEVNMIAGWVTHNEAGHKTYTAYNPDDNGAGISVGLMQWNQERGLLPELVGDWYERNPSRFNRIFGSDAANMLDESWLRSVDFSKSETLTASMKEALSEPQFQAVQLELRNDHIEESCEIARDYGFTALRGRAVIADLVNQLGKGGTKRFLSRVPLSGDESNRIEQLKSQTDDRVNARDRIEKIEEEVRAIWRQQALAQN